MAKDIVELLRTYAVVNAGEPVSAVLDAAAEEIERLRERVSNMGWQLSPDRMGG